MIYLQFDNTHYTRDNPNVPSDLQQMPNLLNFITGNGHADQPRAHAADRAHRRRHRDVGDRPVRQRPGHADRERLPLLHPGGVTDDAGSFAYWTDPIVDYTTPNSAPVGDKTTTLVGQNGKTPPAPWVSYTRAGCDVGSVAAANTELENTTPDVPLVFGANSPDGKEAEGANQNKAAADYEGLSVHCALGSAVCADHHSVADLLPDEPGGYTGYRALFGAKYVDPLLSPAGPVRT